MIKRALAGHRWAMGQASATFDEPVAQGPSSMALLSPEDAQALAKLVHEHHDFIWRSLRRLGLGHGDVDDAVQQVFLIASRRLATIRPGSERSFLFQTALRIASDVRRGLRRRRETAPLDSDKVAQAAIPADELIDLRRAREKLQEILDAMPLDLRAVFILFELDEITMIEIASILQLPTGTVASRLRRAREIFRQHARRVTASRGGPP